MRLWCVVACDDGIVARGLQRSTRKQKKRKKKEKKRWKKKKEEVEVEAAGAAVNHWRPVPRKRDF